MTNPIVAWSEDSPTDNSKKSLFDDRIREVKKQVQQVIAADHKMAASGKSETTGCHNKVTLLVDAAPSEAADKIILYAKDVDEKAEFFAIDEDGDEVQVTFAGKLSFACPTSQPPVLANGMIWQV